MSSFSLLSPNIQKKIWEMRWERFTPIQDNAIPIISNTTKDVVISSGTASGKTEAAFLPILSAIEESGQKALKVIYISPLKALINNQFERIEKLSSYCHLAIHKWHGDVGQNKKKKFIENPTGILQITPESIESLFINRTTYLSKIFGEVEFIVIDEIHAFLDNERGVQLRSLLSRMQPYCHKRPRIIGLSATIDNFDFVKQWICPDDPEQVEIIQANGYEKETRYYLMHFDTEKNAQLPLELYEDMRDLTKENSSIIFCNSRSLVEEATVMLNRLAEKDGLGETYYPHHSSIDKKEREYVEKMMQETTVPKGVVATSSLELGIDIGNVDLVVQLDSTYSVSSLKQRLGRSGRSTGSPHMLQLYSTTAPSLLSSLAVMELVLEGWVEPAKGYALPYDILFHQVLSLLQEYNGIKREELLELLGENAVFRKLPKEKMELLLAHMHEADMIERIQGSGEYIVGIEGERVLRSKEFYAVFMTPEEYEVVSSNRKIGTLHKGIDISEGDHIILAGRLWRILQIDNKRNKVYVEKTVGAKPPRFLGEGGEIHPRIREKMMEILCSDEEFPYLDGKAQEILEDMRTIYRIKHIQPKQRIIKKQREDQVFYTFTGTIIVGTLWRMLQVLGVKAKIGNLDTLTLPSEYNLLQVLKTIQEKDWDVQELLAATPAEQMFFSKFSPYLPQELIADMHIAHQLDIEETIRYLKRYEFVVLGE
ncbi:DEAD/DEAH box helicase [Ectobacillus panaciterrae]|uniref:DEAD/DEAH box helicase n=1 Tax=Ectobacillus panaciterrae TaxID=363872 RepID=UPI000412C9CF|nr:DEAD/DEAH box helicase [Ectobacillus panaciterrae]